MFKFNGGNGAIVCDGCSTMIKDGILYSEYSKISSGYDLCDECYKGLEIVDNFDKLLPLLKFENKDEFYFLQIIQRKKDGNITQVGNNGYRTIKTYYIYSEEQLKNKAPKIKELCIKNNARAYLNINRRNAEEVALSAIQQYAKLISEGNSYQGYRVYDSACGSTKARGYKPIWIIDVDSKDSELVLDIIDIIKSCRGSEEDRIKQVIPTLNGFHILSLGFDTNQFNEELQKSKIPKIDIQKDNPTLLFYAKYK